MLFLVDVVVIYIYVCTYCTGHVVVMYYIMPALLCYLCTGHAVVLYIMLYQLYFTMYVLYWPFLYILCQLCFTMYILYWPCGCYVYILCYASFALLNCILDHCTYVHGLALSWLS